MCLTGKVSVNYEMAAGYKIFSQAEGKLYSAFYAADKIAHYEPNQMLEVYPEEAYFYGFRNHHEAMDIVRHKSRWNMRDNLIILPVTLYQVEYEGSLRCDTSGESYLACMAKKIKVHDDASIRMTYYAYLFKGFLPEIKEAMEYMS